MSQKSVETKVYEWLKSVVETALPDSALHGLIVQDSDAKEMKSDGIYVSNAEWNFSPHGDDLKDYDAFVIIAFYSRIRGTDKSNRLDGRNKAYAMTKAIAQKLFDDQTLAGRFCDSKMMRAYSGNAPVKSDLYAVVNLPLVLEPTGALTDFRINQTA